jgi:hypothetical protein
VSAGGQQKVNLRIHTNSPPPVNVATKHAFTVTARLTNAPQLTWQAQGEWTRNAVQEIIPETKPTPTPTSNPRRFWGCLVMIIGVILTIGFGLLVGNIAFEIFNFGDTETWIIAIIAWIIGIIVTRALASKVSKG